MRGNRVVTALLGAGVPALACGLALAGAPGRGLAASQPQEGKAMSFSVQSTDFAAGGTIPARYTCGGANVSPALSWKNTPPRTKSLALIVDDPDAPRGTWTHWIVWNIPLGTTQLAEAAPDTETLPNGARQGRNDFRKLGYGGPCPPPGRPHRYFFKLFALDTQLALAPGASRRELDEALQGHVLAQADWMGTYGQ